MNLDDKHIKKGDKRKEFLDPKMKYIELIL